MTHQMANIPELDDRLNVQPFIVYRPDRIGQRLEGTYYTDTEQWRPSISYKHTLRDIRNQLTPAEYFRHQLETRGKEIRAVQRLQLRIDRNPDSFNHAASSIQGLYRGRKCRQQFELIKNDLRVEKFRREAKTAAKAAFSAQQFPTAILEVEKLDPPEVIYLSIKIKSLYRLGRYEECINTCVLAVVMDRECEVAYFIQACSLVMLDRISEAYHTMKELMANVEQPMRNSFKLAGYAAAQSSPPLFQEAVDSYSSLISQDPRDFEALLERACCYNCLQEWQLAKKDLNFILAFYPDYVKALLLRARLFTCTRSWDEARNDYKKVLNLEPSNEAALRGLADADDVVHSLPMIGNGVLDNKD